MESNRVDDIIKYVKMHPNSFAVKLHGNGLQQIGLPDVIGSWLGQPFAVEVKDFGKKHTVTLAQEAWLAEFKQGGYTTGIVTTVEDFIYLEWPK